MARKWIQAAHLKKGALRATAKRMGLIHGDENLSEDDLAQLRRVGGKTARRVATTRTLKRLGKR